MKSSTDFWINIFENKTKMETKEMNVTRWDTTDFYKNYVTLKIAKNRLWPWAGSKIDYIIDFNAGGKYIVDKNQI
jgi:hypothetical protein